MGDRGLGQLAYDKGMLVLAATQSDAVALEMRSLRHGLLTFALLEGLKRERGRLKADRGNDGRVDLFELLSNGKSRTPGLYRDAQTHTLAKGLKLVSRDPRPDPMFVRRAISNTQSPALFDFRKRSAEQMNIKVN